MRFYLSRPWIKALAGLSINLSAGWFGAAFIVPNFSGQPGWYLVLTGDILNGIVFLVFTVKLEEILEKLKK